MKRTRASNAGFSLIELLVVVSIILVITAIAVPKFLQARKAGEQSAAAATVKSFVSANATYQSRFNNSYASTADQLMTPAATGTGSCDTSGIYPAPGAPPAAALTWVAGNYTYLWTPGTAAPTAASGCAAAGVLDYTFTATPADTAMDAYFANESGTVRHAVGTATAADSPLGQ